MCKYVLRPLHRPSSLYEVSATAAPLTNIDKGDAIEVPFGIYFSNLNFTSISAPANASNLASLIGMLRSVCADYVEGDLPQILYTSKEQTNNGTMFRFLFFVYSDNAATYLKELISTPVYFHAIYTASNGWRPANIFGPGTNLYPIGTIDFILDTELDPNGGSKKSAAQRSSGQLGLSAALIGLLIVLCDAHALIKLFGLGIGPGW